MLSWKETYRMECFRCGATLKDNALVCNKCGLIMKGAKKIENAEPVMTFEEKVNAASEDELRAWILAYKAAQDAPKKKNKKDDVDIAKKNVETGKKWAVLTLVFGILSCVFIILPGFNIIVALAMFLMCFYGFGKSAGQRGNMALIGVILSVVGILGSWAFNTYLAPSIGESLGLTGTVTEQVQ